MLLTNAPSIISKPSKRTFYHATGDSGAVVSAFAETQKEVRNTLISDFAAEQKVLFQKACSELTKTEENIQQLIDINRGGQTGIHGFIAEQLEVGIGNAKSVMSGYGIRYILLDDNGRDDLLIDACPVQMKFVQKALSLDAVKEHMAKYPEAIGDGEIYMIPKDYWEKLQQLWAITPEEAGKLRNTDYSLWQKLYALSEEGLTSNKLCAAEFDYNRAQKDAYADTIEECRQEVADQKDNAIKKVIAENGPSIAEAAQTIAIGAGMEGTLQGVVTIIEKHQDGINIPDYTKQDVVDVLRASGKGALNGGVRSGVVYFVVNFTPIPAGVASGAYTIAEKAIEIGLKTEDNPVSKEKAKKEMIAIVVDVSITTLLSIAGAKYFKKNKVVGAMIGTVTAKALIYAGKKIYSLVENDVA